MKLTKKQINKIKNRWQGKVPLCTLDTCDYFHIESVPREPSEDVCSCPGAEQKGSSIGCCIAAIIYKMERIPD